MKIKIDNLSVNVFDKKILNNLNLEINPQEIHVIMGPNGVGKSTLSKVIMGYPDYKIINGDILINSNSINNLSIDERARLGIFLVYQNPINIDGVTNREILKSIYDSNNQEKKSLYQFINDISINMKSLNMKEDMLNRDFNVGFSGGEKKKNEILQLLTLKPKFIILDELDSGLDVDSLKIVCNTLNNYVNENKDVSLLIITHYTRILDYLKPNYVHIIKNGSIIKSGSYKLAKLIEKNGYNQSFDIEEDDLYE